MKEKALSNSEESLPANLAELKFAYQPECNTKNLREFLKQHAGLLTILTFCAPVLAGIGWFVFFIFIGGLSSAISGNNGIGMGYNSGFFAVWQIFSLVIAPVFVYFGIKTFKVVFQPTHLILRPQGIFIHWQQRVGRPTIKLADWNEIKYLDLLRIENKTRELEQFVVLKGREGEKEKRIKLSGIVEASGRTQFLEALQRWGENIPRNPELNLLLEPQEESSYTELWLSALSQAPERESLAPLEPGALRKSGKYRVLNKIAMGGQGTAYTAELAGGEAGGLVVLKEYVLPTKVGAKARNESIESLRNEADILARLNHENVVKLLDYFVEDHRGYLVLEHIDGDNLRNLVQRNGRMKEADVIKLAEQMCDILACLHGQNPPIVHRDFTPDNLILTSSGLLKLIDFNVAKQTAETVTATVVGKHAYIPIEQFRGKPCTQSDIFAMGATLFYLLTGHDPEPLAQSFPKQFDPEISDKFNSIVERATDLSCASRYANVDEIRRDLCAS